MFTATKVPLVVASLVLLGALILVAGPQEAPRQESPLDPELASCRTAALDARRQDRLPGLSVAVLRRGDILFSEVYGWSKRRGKPPVTPHTQFRVGSVSKSLTSAALGALVDRGQLDLDAPVQTYAPSFPDKGAPITTRLAAAHLSGIPHYERGDFLNKTAYASATEALDKFRDRPLVAPPGERCAYSSFGWNLVGAVLEGASGKAFGELLRQEVLAPLGLDDTVLETSPRTDSAALHYARVGRFNLWAPKLEPSDAWPSAGFLSTAEDLVRFGDAMLRRRLLSEETAELLWRQTVDAEGAETGWGLGWEHATKGGYAAIGHGGSHVGATAALWIVPEQELVVAVLTNTNSGVVRGLVDRLVECAVGPPASGNGSGSGPGSPARPH